MLIPLFSDLHIRLTTMSYLTKSISASFWRQYLCHECLKIEARQARDNIFYLLRLRYLKKETGLLALSKSKIEAGTFKAKRKIQ